MKLYVTDGVKTIFTSCKSVAIFPMDDVVTMIGYSNITYTTVIDRTLCDIADNEAIKFEIPVLLKLANIDEVLTIESGIISSPTLKLIGIKILPYQPTQLDMQFHYVSKPVDNKLLQKVLYAFAGFETILPQVRFHNDKIVLNTNYVYMVIDGYEATRDFAIPYKILKSNLKENSVMATEDAIWFKGVGLSISLPKPKCIPYRDLFDPETFNKLSTVEFQDFNTEILNHIKSPTQSLFRVKDGKAFVFVRDSMNFIGANIKPDYEIYCPMKIINLILRLFDTCDLYSDGKVYMLKNNRLSLYVPLTVKGEINGPGKINQS